MSIEAVNTLDKPNPAMITQDSRGNRFLEIKERSIETCIPIYTVRNPDHHDLIAKATSTGRPIAFQAAGVFGIMIAVENSREESENGRLFWKIKEGRGIEDKVPFLLHPRDLPRIADFSKVHPDFRYLEDPEARERFWGRIPFHLIVPVIEDLPVVNPEIFVTSEAEYRKKPLDQYVPFPTVSDYFQLDTDWSDLAKICGRYSHRTLFGITSFNKKNEHSPYNLTQLKDYIGQKALDGFLDFLDLACIVDDEAASITNMQSSKLMIRLPVVGETPQIRVHRKGPGLNLLSRQTGHDVIILESAKWASRGYPEDVNLDPKVLEFVHHANRIMTMRERALAS